MCNESADVRARLSRLAAHASDALHGVPDLHLQALRRRLARFDPDTSGRAEQDLEHLLRTAEHASRPHDATLSRRLRRYRRLVESGS